MREVDQLIMIIPVVLNLKGNLEMNLSARLGTAANVGELDDPKNRRSIIFGSLSLLQVQAAVVSFVAACVSYVLGIIILQIQGHAPTQPPSEPQATSALLLHLLHTRAPHRPIPHDNVRKSGFSEFVMVSSTAMMAASLSSVILGSFMCFLIVLCRRFGRDPDNIAPPIASCLGDLVTLILIGGTSTVLIRVIRTPVPLLACIFIVCVALSCLMITRRNPHVKDLIYQGWSPLFGAMVISSCTGIVLDLFVSRYQGFALLAVVISGLPGSVGSIFVSRLSTALHAAALPSTPSRPHAEPSARTVMITLIVITLPVEIIFLAILRGLGWLRLPFVFVAFSVVFFCCAVTASLIIARYLTNFLWARKYDPDMYALPIHSALMDLIGQLLLVLCFEIVSKLGGMVRSVA
ncbi:hypothetical protein HGRIS_013800 [Hohenbuehelia grisea]|uniref:SLC41A/MgtE integral membrane domain-containing protein n=1 Tax=Hohenbuehelia grisea TaxID=104357 RepID=A0ABR3IWW9_9AGAR